MIRYRGTEQPSIRPALRVGCAAAALALAALGSPRAAVSQQITGRVLDRVTSRPVGAGFVVLLDSSETELRRVLSDAEGRFVMTLRPGSYFLRSERIGYRATTSDLVRLLGGDTLEITLDVARIPYALDRIEVSEERVCGLPPDASNEMLTVWQEAEKALRAAVWTAGQRAYRYTVNLRDRRVHADGQSIREETDSTVEALTAVPFRAPRPGLLAGGGYVVPQRDGTTSYYAPDAAVLIHDTFIASHCFSVVQDGPSVGLAFEPKPDRELPDIRGTLWLDAATGQLHEVEYRYSGLDRRATDRTVGGIIEFMAVPSGEWIVHRWQIRMPELGWVATDRRARARIRGYQDAMGEVLAIHDRDGATVYSVPPAIVEGSVFDSTSARPLAGARVLLSGSARTATTDDHGRFRLSGPLRGRYAVTAEHARLDSLGASIHPQHIDLEPGQSRTLTLATPSVETIWNRMCPEHPAAVPGSEDETANAWAVFGRVVSQDGSGRIDSVNVTATWRAIPRTRGALVLQDWVAHTHAGGDGAYALCGLPVETPIRLTAFDSTRISRTTTLHFDRRQTTVSLVDVESHAWHLPFWRRDITIAAAPHPQAAITGRFLDESGQPIAGVTVSIPGIQGLTTSSDSSGRFTLDSIPAGTRLIAVRRVGYRPIAYSATLHAGERYRLPPTVTNLVAGSGVELDPIIVTAERAMTAVMRGFEERRASGFGDHLTREEFDASSPTVATDLLRRMQGVRVSANPNYGRPLSDGRRDTRRVVIMNRRAAERGPCPMLVFLDGVLMGTTEDLTVDNLINVYAVEAIEVYTGLGQTPSAFNLAGAECGVIVFWTR